MTSPKANPPKPTAAKSISEDEATENDSRKYGEGGSRLRPKWDGMTQHGKDFPNRVVNTTTQRMSLMWSRSRPTNQKKFLKNLTLHTENPKGGICAEN